MAIATDHRQRLLDTIARRTARFGLVGLGYAGLPLGVELAEAGLHCTGIDVDPAKVAAIRRGESYIPDIPSAQIARLVDAGRLTASTDYDVLSDIDAVSICVPTPLRKTKDPDVSYILAATEELVKHVHPGMLIILESTTYPGTTEEILLPPLVRQGLVPGEDVFVAFSPERVDPGNTQFGMRTTPKVIGGVTPACCEVATALYSAAVDRIVTVSSPAAAEMVKLLENTFRAVNIGLVNEIAIMCDHLGLDVWEIIEAAATKPFGYMKFTPGPGLGGHCIPVDPLYLLWRLRGLDYEARFIALADDINKHMPRYVVNKIADALNDDRKAVNGSRVLILGVTYKPDVDDVRESPAIDILELLRQRGAEVAYHDPYVPALTLGEHTLRCQELTESLLREADCVVVVANHRRYDWPAVAAQASLVVDTRNALAGCNGTARVVKL